DWNRIPDMHKITVPTLIVCGQHDEITPACSMRMHNALPDSEITVFPNSSHMAMYEEPEAYFARLTAFLDKQRRGDKSKRRESASHREGIMPIEPPNADHIQEIAADFGIALRPEDAQSFAGLLQGIAGSYGRLDELVEPKPEVTYPRTAGYRPGPEENPYNAWAWKSTIKGASKGVLAGKKIAAKDNVCVAGLPMQNGSRVMEGYVPEVDATVVTRILDAGGTIVGKTVCEDLCFSGGSHTSKPVPVKNPHKPTHSAGRPPSARR